MCALMVVQTDDPLMGYEIQVWVGDYSVVPRVKSDLAAPPPATAVLGDFMRSPAPPSPAGA